MCVLPVMLPLSARDAHVFINELRLNNVNNTTSAYMKAAEPVYEDVRDNTTFLKKESNFEVTEINKKLPNIYRTPKLYKNQSL